MGYAAHTYLVPVESDLPGIFSVPPGCAVFFPLRAGAGLPGADGGAGAHGDRTAIRRTAIFFLNRYGFRPHRLLSCMLTNRNAT